MPLTQEKPLDNNFTNNNDSSYLHKKFKKMASSIAVFPANQSIAGDTKYSDTNIAQVACNSLFPHGKITSSHEELQKTTERQENHITYYVREEGKHVQISLGNENSSKNEKNNPDQVSGQTSFTDELSNKTENIENDFIRDTHNINASGRYVCPYCKISCAKPSVLQKHIRAHTNERPYPCVPCGFAFKTKSNLYKHRRSRTHALRLQGSDVNAASNDDDLSGGSESDSSQPPTSSSDVGSDLSISRHENNRLFEFSSPEVTNDRITPPSIMTFTDCKLKTIYKPKFRAALYQENEDKDKIKKTISQNADFLTEHISKIISDNEAIVDVIETPLQKKYGKIKQIAESKQMQNDQIEIKSDPSPLNLTKNNSDVENTFRKRSHSESFPHNDNQKHPLNPEGSIIKDLLLKNKANGLISLSCRSEPTEGPVYMCPVCQVKYVSADNLEIHRMYYCKTNLISNIATMNNIQKDISNCNKRENLFTRSNSINVRLPEAQLNKSTSPSYKIKPDNLVIIKPECNDVIAPLPSPGPLLGNTRLVDSRIPADHIKKTENIKIKPTSSPKRKLDNSEPYNTRLAENISPQITDMYQQAKIRCIDATSFRSVDDLPHNMRQNSTSLQMFGGEVKIVDHSGGTTTLRIEPSKNQLSPITVQPTLSPSKLASDAEASSVVVRSGLHSGGTMVHNPPTPKEIISTPHTPRISLSNTPGISNNLLSVHDITHFQFPPFNAITAFNPLTLPPLSPPISPNGTSTILHAGKLIPHVPGIPGPNTPGLYMRSRPPQPKNMCNEVFRTSTEQKKESTLYDNVITTTQAIKTSLTNKFEEATNNRTANLKSPHEKQHCNMYRIEMVQNHPTVPLIKVKPAEDQFFSKSSHSLVKSIVNRQDGPIKRSPEGLIKTLPLVNTPYQKYPPKCHNSNSCSSVESKADTEIRTFNFENLITKTEIYNNQVISSTDVQKNTNAQDILMTSIQNERSETAYFQKCNNTKTGSDERKTKFLRPTSLPLKPGTYTPKKHHGITPNANTMPLISPETPRPAKAYGQLYLNGNAYTYLGLKCSTKVFYCTINRPQPTYVPNQHFLSMYSNWQLLSELTPDPLGLSASSAMSLYDSRHRPQNVSVAVIKQDLILTHSSQWNTNTKVSKHAMFSGDSKRIEDNKALISETTLTPKKELTGGFESNEEYTYVRGRGRGRYVCSECGIRCKKPSMLKKHIRTHTDVRPYTCVHCAFSFKTKGNLTKHMKSKAHYKKCCELGINPNEGNETECTDISQCLGETDDDTESDGDEGNEGETESSDTEACKSQLPEHEAARCLLSLGCSRQLTPATPGLITSARPSTYPYTPKGAENSVLEIDAEKLQESNDIVVESKPELDSEPIDLSKNDVKVISSSSEIPTARESSVLASLASNTAKLPQHQNQWSNGEPMLHTYLTERALLDSKIKQSQLSTGMPKLKKVDLEKPSFIENLTQNHNTEAQINLTTTNKKIENSVVSPPHVGKDDKMDVNDQTLNESSNNKQNWVSNNSGAENAKHVVSEYLKHARINLIKSRDDSHHLQKDNGSDIQSCLEESNNVEDPTAESDATFSNVDHDTVARKVVIGAGGVTFKFSKGKEFDTSYSPGRLMEDGRRVCDFCNKTFTKPSQLRLHLNIHYMERPFRCSACAVSFRTRGHLQKHERSGSHHNKVSMTSTFGAATSLNPRPFRCSDCNIAFRIHGHLAKHLRSKMHVMRLECLFKLPFGTFTEIERAGVSLTDIDTTDCESSLASLQTLARKLHEKDPTKLEYRDPNGISLGCSSVRESSEDDDTSMLLDKPCESERNDEKTIENSESRDNDISVNYSATDNIN